jgi:hypothetical protein
LAWKLTVRHGSEVDRGSYEDLEEALAEARGRAAQVLSEGGLGTVSAFRDYEPGDRVQARIEVSGGGFLRGPEAGIDVMGDGALVPYSGAIRKRRLEAGGLDEAIERVRAALTPG